MDGWIKIHRKIEDWQWASNPVMFYFWIKLLVIVNWEDKEWEGQIVERGSIITSIAKLASKLSLSPKQVRTCIDRLKKGKQIITETASKWTKITICNYEDYQGCAETEGQAKGKQSGKQRATTKEIKEDKNIPPLSKERVPPLTERQKNFYDSLLPFLGKYDKKMLRDFYDYWSEPNRQNTKMKCELQETWYLEGRLATWKRKEDEKATKRTQQATKPTKLDQYKAQAQRLGLLDYDTDQSNSIDEQ